MKNKVVISNIKGGLGNQLFQYATGLAIAIRYDAVYKIDLSFFENEKYSNAFSLNNFNIPYSIANIQDYEALINTRSSPLLYERILTKLKVQNKFNKRTHIIDTFGFKPSKNILKAKPPCYIEGWCVKEIYFTNIKEHLGKIYTPKNPLTNNANYYLDQISSCNSVSIHIRRGDYIGNDFFETVPLNYYKLAISEISKKVEKAIYFVFSDDLNWAKSNLSDIVNCQFVDLPSINNYNGKCDIEDFFLMKNCKNNIISNSSFSWWAAYLNENPDNIVISPKKWYKNKIYQDSLELYSIFLKNWIIL